MTVTHPPAPALHIVHTGQPSEATAEANTRIFVLSGWDETTSAATEPWALLKITGPNGPGRWSHRVHRLGPEPADTGGWEERLRALSEAGVEVGPDVLRYWQETANGVVWEITELSPPP